MAVFPSDIVGEIASFLPSTTNSQRPLMLVCSTWFDGVVAQNGMQPMPHVRWPWVALRRREPKKVRLTGGTNDDVRNLVEFYPQVSGVKFCCCDGLNDHGLKHLCQAPHLEGLHIHFCPNVTDVGLGAISDTFEDSLTRLHLDGVSANVTLDTLGNLKHLTDFEVYWTSDGLVLPEANIASLDLWRRLQRLHIASSHNGMAASSELLQCVATLTELEDLCLGDVQLADPEKLKQWWSLKKMKEVSFSFENVEKETLQLLFHEWTNLSVATVKFCPKMGQSVFDVDVSLPFLTTVNFVGCKNVDNETILQLTRRAPNLQKMRIGATPGVSDDGIAHLARLPKLHSLELWRLENVSDCCIAHICNLPALTELCVYRCLITGEGFRHGQFPQLKKLQFQMCSVSSMIMACVFCRRTPSI